MMPGLARQKGSPMLFWSFGFVAAVAVTVGANRLDRWREAQWAVAS